MYYFNFIIFQNIILKLYYAANSSQQLQATFSSFSRRESGGTGTKYQVIIIKTIKKIIMIYYLFYLFFTIILFIINYIYNILFITICNRLGLKKTFRAQELSAK